MAPANAPFAISNLGVSQSAPAWTVDGVTVPVVAEAPMPVSDRTLMAATLGVLDPGDALALGASLGPSEHLRQSGLAALAEVSQANALPGPSLTRSSSGVLGAHTHVRPGDRVSFALHWPALPADARCA